MPLSGRKPSFRTRSWARRERVVLLTFIGINTAVFVGQLFLETSQPGFVRDYLGISDRGVRDAYAWQFVTALFLHTGPWHFAANILMLFLLGRDVEAILGQRHFLYLYLSGAVGGELGHLFLMPSETVLMGAWGGAAAVLIAYAMILPELELSSLISLGLPLRIKASHLACGAIGIGLFLLCFDRDGTIGHSALLGGCVAGAVYAHLLGFGQTSFVQRIINRRRAEKIRYQQMGADQFMTEEINPLLEKISRSGMGSLTKTERRKLSDARDKILQKQVR